MTNQGNTRERERESKKIIEFSWQKLYQAYLACRLGKRRSYYALKFEINFEKELLALEQELLAQTYQPSQSICFVVTEPTMREIFAANFRDRVVHHLLVNFLEPVFEKKFIDQSYACRQNKGIHQSINDLKKYIRQITTAQTQPYYLHLDIKSFFISLDKKVLYDIIVKYINNPRILWLSQIIIFHQPATNFRRKGDLTLWQKVPRHKSLFFAPINQGLPIGNLTSQFFANVYLNELDHYVKHRLKVKYYLRYVDDFLLLAEDKEQLIIWQKQIAIFLQTKLHLQLNAQKQILKPINQGIDWLGYIVAPTHILVRQQVVDNCKQRLKIFNNQLSINNNQTPAPKLLLKILSTINSYYGHFSHADSFKLRQHLYQCHFQKIVDYLEPKNDRLNSFVLKKQPKPSKPK